MTNQPVWYIAVEWVHATRTAVERECRRLEGTIRYRLGATVIELLKTPWRVVGLIKILAGLVREKGKGFQPIDLDPIVTPAPLGDHDETAALSARAQMQRRWYAAHKISASPDYTLGAFLIELRSKPWNIWRLFVVGFRLLRSPTYTDSIWCPQSLRTLTPSPPPSRSVNAVMGPKWFLEMAAYEGVPPLNHAGASLSSVLIGLEIEPARDGASDEILEAGRDARAAGARVALWLLGSESLQPSSLHEDWFAAADVVFTDAASNVEWLGSRLSMPVTHLPAAVQPRLQNPTGRSRNDLTQRSDLFDQLPGGWRVLEPIAQGRATSADECHEVELVLDEALPMACAPAWTTQVERDERNQFLRSHYMMKHHCFATRLDEVASALDNPRVGCRTPLISVVVCTMRPGMIAAVLAGFERQNHPHKELILVLHGEHFDIKRVDELLKATEVTVRWLRAPSHLTLGECVQLGFEESEGDFIVKIDDDDWYGSLFLETQLQASVFSFAGVVGKGSYLIRFESDASMYYLFPGREYRYMELFGGNRMLVRRAVHEEISWRALAHGEDTAFIRDCLVNSVPMYSADGYHFVIRRFEPRDHTWKIGKTELLATHHGVRLPEVAGLHDFDPEPRWE